MYLYLNLATFQYIDGFAMMLSFLLKQNWIGIDYFLLNVFATFASVLRLQITVTFGSVFGLQATVDCTLKWIAATNTLGAMCCKHNAASP